MVNDNEKQEDVVHQDNVGDLQADAKERVAVVQHATVEEHTMSFWQAFKAYKKGVFWSVVVSMCIVMESYDTILIGTLFAYPSFQERFGDQIAPGKFSLPAQWQTALSLASTVGIVIGIFFNGYLIDRYGHRILLLASLFVLTGFIALTFAATSREMLLAGQLLCGLPWGVINTIAPSYAIETAPLALRHYGPTFVNLCWVIGHLVGAGVLDALVGDTSQWGWRIPFALQWMFPLPLFVAILFAPDSPWWLIRRGRKEDAIKALKRLSDSSVNSEEAAALIEHTVAYENQLNFGVTYWDCFKGVDRRRTEIAMVNWAAQMLVVFCIQGYQAYFFQQAGVPTSDAFKLNLGAYCISFVGTSLSMPLQARFGRRTIWLAGMVWMFPCTLLIGILACLEQTSGIKYAQAAIFLVNFFGYGWSPGPLSYTICSEIGSARLRQKTLSLSRNSYYVFSIINSVVAPYLLNPTKADLKGKAAFVPAFFLALTAVYSYFRLPETKGRSFHELDVLFAKKVPARDFKKYSTEELLRDEAEDTMAAAH